MVDGPVPAAARPSRRAVVRSAGLAALGVAAGCGGRSRAPGAPSGPGATAGPDAAAVRRARADEAALIAGYDRAAADPALAPVRGLLAGLRADHVRHLAVLDRLAPLPPGAPATAAPPAGAAGAASPGAEPSGAASSGAAGSAAGSAATSPGPASRRATAVAALHRSEQAAAEARAADSLPVTGRLAALLGSIAACERSHVVALASVRPAAGGRPGAGPTDAGATHGR